MSSPPGRFVTYSPGRTQVLRGCDRGAMSFGVAMARVRAVQPRRERATDPRPPLLHRVSEGQLLLLDRLIAGLMVLVAVIHLWRFASGTGPGEADGVFVWVLAALCFAIRRRNAVAALALMTATVLVGVALGRSGAATNVPDALIAVPMYQVASTTPRLPSLAGLAAELLLLGGLAAASGLRGLAGAAVGTALVATAAWFVGDSVRVRRVYVAGLAEQAAQRQREELERAQRSLAEERLQIARELHDVVAHSLAVIAVQSGVGRHVIDSNPAEAKRSLTAVQTTSRAALDELRRMLGVLRGDEQQPAELSPAPGISGLVHLVDQVRSAGVPVELEISSSVADALSPAAELSLYRIVQEGLTNVVKHAGPAKAHVRLRDDGPELVLEVLDDGNGPLAPNPRSDEPSAHHGVIGMRERVALFGGSFEAGPQSNGGFAVIVRLPRDRVCGR